ncbi:MAG: DUF2190 family protein [Synergistaceae bacterium]|nr:DUF2190 family protein [Synergistaceae bacterium]
MHNPMLIKTFNADGDIGDDKFIVLKNDGSVSQANSASQYILGATDRLGARHGDKIDVILQGIAEVQAGETITAPAVVTANDHGQAVVAPNGNPSAGLAITSAAAGEVVSVLLGRYASAAAQTAASEQQNDNQQNNEPEAIAVTDETVTYNTEASAFVLAHYPVVADSLVVKSSDGETTYTFNTDYTVTLAEGKITAVDNTTMTFAENAVIKCSYQYTASA